MTAIPTLAEIEATIVRMEARYAGSPHFTAYERLRLRFAEDLADPRDLALSRAAALMVLKTIQEDGGR